MIFTVLSVAKEVKLAGKFWFGFSRIALGLQSKMAGKPTDFDEIMSFLGVYGPFQILITVLFCLSAIPCGYLGIILVFVSDTPEHHCSVSISSTLNGTDVELPFHERSSWIGPDSCSRYKVDGEWMLLKNDTEPCLDGWDYSTEKYATSIVSEVSGCAE